MAKWFLIVLACLITIDAHAQWMQTLSLSETNGITDAFAVIGTNLFAGTSSHGVYRSTDNGTSWASVNSGLTPPNVASLAVIGTNLFAGTYGGVFRSTDNGTSWTPASTGLEDTSIYALAVIGTNLFAGNKYGVYRSTDNGTSWAGAYTGITNPPVYSLAVSGTNIYAGSKFSNVYFSTNEGASWTEIDADYSGGPVQCLAINGTNLFAGSYFGGVYRSTNNGAHWLGVDSGLVANNAGTLDVIGVNLFAGTYAGVYLSTDNGTFWTGVDSGLGSGTSSDVRALTSFGTYLFAGTGGGVWRRQLSEMITGVAEKGGGLPGQFALFQNYPNPFNPTTVIGYQLPVSAHVTLRVYNVLGQEVATLANNLEQAGDRSAEWNAVNMASGIYFYELEATSVADPAKVFTRAGKMVLIR